MSLPGPAAQAQVAPTFQSEAATQGEGQTTAALVPASDTLQSVLASVYLGNPQLLAERSRLREVDETYIQARAEGRPSVGLGGSASLDFTRAPAGEPNPFNPAAGEWVDTQPRSAQLTLIQPLYQGGRVKALKQQAKASIMAARAGLEGAENDIFLSAASAYVDLLRDDAVAQIRRNNVRVLSRQLAAANTRFEVGEGTRTDIAQSESRLAAAEAGLAQTDAVLASTRAVFMRLVGRLPVALAPVPDFVLPESLDRATALARDNNPQLLAAYYNERVGLAAIDVARAAGRPTLSLQSSLARSRGSLLGFSDADQAIVGAQLNVPIFSGGANASRVRQAKHARTRLGFEARDAERAVDQVVAQVWAQLEAARRIVETGRRQVAAAEVAFEGVTLEQQVGTRTQLDVLDAEQETLNARLTLLNAERDYNAAVFQLLATIGVFDADGLDLPIPLHDPNLHLNDVRNDGFARVSDRLIPDTLRDDSALPVVIVGPPVAADARPSDAPTVANDADTALIPSLDE